MQVVKRVKVIEECYNVLIIIVAFCGLRQGLLKGLLVLVPDFYARKFVTAYWALGFLSEQPVRYRVRAEHVTTWKLYYDLVNKFGSEFAVLLDAEFEEMKKIVDEGIAKAIIDTREGKTKIMPGYDGEYGYPSFNGKVKEVKLEKQKQLGLSSFC